MHLASTRDLFLAYNWDVVLRLAGNRARAAANARAKIYYHSPRIGAVLVFVGIVKCLIASWFFSLTRNSFGIGEKLRECAGAQEIAPLHRVMLLGRGERMFFARFPNRQPIAKPKRIRRAQRIRVKPTIFANAANFATAVTEMKRNRIFGLPRLNPNRRFEFTTPKCQLDNISIVDLFAPSKRRTDQRGIIPSQL